MHSVYAIVQSKIEDGHGPTQLPEWVVVRWRTGGRSSWRFLLNHYIPPVWYTIIVVDESTERSIIRDGFAHNGIAHDTHHAFVGGQLLPAHITDRTADSRCLDCLSCTTQGLRRVQHCLTHTFAGSRRCRTDTFCGLAREFSIVYSKCPTSIVCFLRSYISSSMCCVAWQLPRCIVFGIRPKLKMMNKKLQRLTKAVKYTTMGDIWREIDEGARPVAGKRDIVEAAKRRWRQIGRNVRP